MRFVIYPAIDLREGRVVRLRQGDPAAQTVFGDDPTEVARRWAAEGAEWLHVVNLEGALSQAATVRRGGGEGLPLNLRRLAEIRAAVEIPIQFGGGIRTIADLERALELGATRVVLGTAAVREADIVAEAVKRFGADRVAVGVDAREGRVAVAGWQEATEISAPDLAKRMAGLGVARIVYTDIGRDGTLAGANVEATAALAQESGLRVIASGGVAGLADIRALAARQSDGIEGAIIGQALYTGAIALGEAIAAGRGI